MGTPSSNPNACNNTSISGFTSASICPSGWRLPTSGTSGEFTYLNNVVNSGSTSSPAGLLSNWLGVYSGAYTSGLAGQGTWGNYWSSTVVGVTNANALLFRASNVGTATSYVKYYGYAVRCVQ